MRDKESQWVQLTELEGLWGRGGVGWRTQEGQSIQSWCLLPQGQIPEPRRYCACLLGILTPTVRGLAGRNVPFSENFSYSKYSLSSYSVCSQRSFLHQIFIECLVCDQRCAEVVCVCVCVCVCVAGAGRMCEGNSSWRSSGGTGTAHKSAESGKGRASLVWGALVVSLGLLHGHPQGPQLYPEHLSWSPLDGGRPASLLSTGGSLCQ